MLRGTERRRQWGRDLCVTVGLARGRSLQDSGNPNVSQLLKVGQDVVGKGGRGSWRVLPGRQYLLGHGFGLLTISFPVIFSHTVTCGYKTVQLNVLVMSPLFLLCSMGKYLTWCIIYLWSYFVPVAVVY